MKKIILSFVILCIAAMSYAQCTLTNATSCYCRDSAETDCDLLPDITVSKYAILHYSGPTEYAQNAALPNAGRLLVTFYS